MFKKIDQVDFFDNKYLTTYLCTYYAYSRKIDIYEASNFVSNSKKIRKDLYEEVIKFFAGEDIIINEKKEEEQEQGYEIENSNKFTIPIILNNIKKIRQSRY